MLSLKRFGTGYGAMLTVATLLLAFTCPSHAEYGNNFGRNAVGGVSINADGVLSQMSRGDVDALRRERIRAMDDLPEGLNQNSELRKISLREIQEAIVASGESDLTKLPHHIRYLAGLQRVQYVFVYPEKKDIVLVGPGEAWTVDENGVVVGQKSQQPVVNLEDLVTALRYALTSSRGIIDCSIDPTPEGMKRFEAVNAQFQARPPKARVAMRKFEEAIGLQVISVNGVDPQSRFATVLVAADYRMKRLAMGLEKSPVRGLPSFLNMIKSSSNIKNMMPRWWLEEDYEAIHTDDEGLSFELRGQGVKAMAASESMEDDGTRVTVANTDPLATRWANNMTKKYNALSRKAPIFAELRNCMDLAVVAALIASEDLPQRAGLNVDLLLDPVALKVPRYRAPTRVPTVASSTKIRGFTAITASGGVSLNPWKAAANRQQDAEVGKTRANATEPASAAWWWN